MSVQKKLVYIGKQEIIQLIDHMALSREEIAKRIGLSAGGLYHITHKSGKIEYSNWLKFKKEYKKITGNEPDIKEKYDSIYLEKATLEELLVEITSRGWEVLVKKRI